jgi:hypothetical protein
MKGLYRRLPPVSPDTSGFCSVIMRTDGVGILDDPQGCATNYISGEEADIQLDTRVFASHLSDIDVVFGSQKCLLERFQESRDLLAPAFSAFGGSPVTSLIGTDLRAAARECSERFALPCCAVELNGHDAYDTGVAATLLALGKLLLKPQGEPLPNSVNLLGVNALDLGARTVQLLPERISENGTPVLSAWGGFATAEQMRRAARAQRNIVLTVSGIPLAEWMEETFGIPYSVWMPRKADGCVPHRRERVLILGEQLSSNRLRTILRRYFGFQTVCVACLFTMDERWREPGDLKIGNEEELSALFRIGTFDLCICDPLFSALAPGGCPIIGLPHPAISGKQYMEQMPLLTEKELTGWLEDALLQIGLHGGE